MGDPCSQVFPFPHSSVSSTGAFRVNCFLPTPDHKLLFSLFYYYTVLYGSNLWPICGHGHFHPTMKWIKFTFQKPFSFQDFGEWILDFCHRIHNTFRIDVFLRIAIFLFEHEQYQKIRSSPKARSNRPMTVRRMGMRK